MSHRLAKLLTSRGAPFDVVDDVAQEVAARALAHRVTFTDAADLMRWAVPVALNLLVDHVRAAQRVTYGDPEQEDAVPDVADLVVHRERVGRVLGAVAELSPADRAALTGYGETPADRREAVKLAVRRHRARRRLLAIVDGVAGIVFGLLRRARPAAPAAVVAMALPVAFLLSVPAPEHSAIVEATVRPVTVPHRVSQVVGASRPRAVPPAATASAPRSTRAVRRAPHYPTVRIAHAGPEKANVTVTDREAHQGDGLVCVRGLDLDVVPDFCVLDR